MKLALVVIDMQNEVIAQQPYQIEQLIVLQQDLIATCREREIEVIFVRHQDKDLPFGTDGWKIYQKLMPKKTDKVVDKHYNSIFKETDLENYLQERQIDSLILTGLQTDYCIDVSIKIAFELGYRIFVPQMGTSTFSWQKFKAEDLIHYYESIWHNRFAQVVPVDDILERIK